MIFLEILGGFPALLQLIIQIMRRSIFMTALAVAALASCNRIDTPEMGNNALDISVRNGIGTKAVIEGTTLPNGSSIGLFVTDESGKTYDGNTVANVKYTATGEGESQKWNAVSDVLLSATVASIGSYYPYDESVYDITAIPVEATSEVQKDWMWGTPVSGLDNKNTSATITMNHALAAIRLNFIKGSFAGTGNIDYVSIESSGAASSAVMNATNGELTDIKGAGYIFESTDEFTLSEGGTNVDFIVVPAGTEAPMDICVLVNGAEMVATTAGMTLEAGKIYEYTISVGVEALQFNKINVTEWTHGEVLEQMFEPYAPKVEITGTTDGIRLERSYVNRTYILKAIPTHEGYTVNKASVSGGIPTQSVDENGIRTIEITDIVSDVKVTFAGTTYVPWARIQHVDGTLYTAEEWLAAEAAGTVTDADANGVAIRYSRKTKCPHIIHPNLSSSQLKFSSTSIVIPNVYTTTDSKKAIYDINGKANTDAIILATKQGLMSSPAANYCVNTIFANGQQGYLPAAGEAAATFDNDVIVNACLEAIGGDLIQTLKSTSTQYSAGSHYQASYKSYTANTGDVWENYKNYEYIVRPVTSFIF